MNNSVTPITLNELFEIVAKATSTPTEALFLDTSVMNIYGNRYKLGLTLYDLHELTGIQPDYTEEEFVNKFKTIQDIANYFALA